MDANIKRNIILRDTATVEKYTSRRGGSPDKIIKRDRDTHASRLLKEWNSACEAAEEQSKQYHSDREGFYLKFISSEGVSLYTKGLEDLREDIRLSNLQKENSIEKATVFIPSNSKDKLFSKLVKYSDHEKDREKGNPANNKLFSNIETVAAAFVDDLWTGAPNKKPTYSQRKWVEVWLRTPRSDDAAIEAKFKEQLQLLGISFSASLIRFPERVVFSIHADLSDLERLVSSFGFIAEIRENLIPASFFHELPGKEQSLWINDTLGKTNFNFGSAVICILDSGVNREHPLLKPFLPSKAMYAVKDSWNAIDTYKPNGHGTCVAGVAIYNDLETVLASSDVTEVSHRLESVKLYDPEDPEFDSELYGDITRQAVDLVSINNAAEKNRIFCSAVTTDDTEITDGTPSSWSAAVDEIISHADDPNEEHELFLIAGGNVSTLKMEEVGYPEANETNSVRSPGQAWNALTIGAFCESDIITEPIFVKGGFTPVAGKGMLSAYSSTSVSWNAKAPIKPEVIFPGGDMATDTNSYSDCPDLALLTTGAHITSRPLVPFSGTSAAVSKAAWMAAELRNEYPQLWPETIRGLIVHSARWTKEMLTHYLPDAGMDSKQKGRKTLLRSCGYGVPDLNRAIQCVDNRVNLIIEGELQPFQKRNNKTKTNEMHFHKIPWPKEELEKLQDTDAIFRVTISYYIEPGPGCVGWNDRYRYPSHGLRFDVNRPGETFAEFESRINKASESDKKADTPVSERRDWFLGPENRDVGSIHSDFEKASAISLSDIEYIAVYPVSGWWRLRDFLNKTDSIARYSLIVSIETPEEEANLYNEIVAKISIPL